MGRMTKAQRVAKMTRALELSVKGWTQTDIGKELRVSRPTVRSLIDDELANRAEHRDHDKERAIATYQAIIAEGWARLESLDSRSHNVSGILNSTRAAQERIDKITGAEAPYKHQDVTDTYEILFDDEESFGIAAD